MPSINQLREELRLAVGRELASYPPSSTSAIDTWREVGRIYAELEAALTAAAQACQESEPQSSLDAKKCDP